MRACRWPAASPGLSGHLPERGERLARFVALTPARQDPFARGRHGYGRGGTGGVVPSTQTGIPWEVVVTVELVRPAEVASMTDVPA